MEAPVIPSDFVPYGVEQHKRRPLERVSRAPPAVQTIVLRARDRVGGTVREARFPPILTPGRMAKRGFFILDSFAVIDTTLASPYLAAEIHVNLPQADSFDSGTRGAATVVGIGMLPLITNDVTTASVGVPIMDMNVLQNTPLTIGLWVAGDGGGSPLNVVDWTAVFRLIENVD
jgi:hypothetical protein